MNKNVSYGPIVSSPLFIVQDNYWGGGVSITYWNKGINGMIDDNTVAVWKIKPKN